MATGPGGYRGASGAGMHQHPSGPPVGARGLRRGHPSPCQGFAGSCLSLACCTSRGRGRERPPWSCAGLSRIPGGAVLGAELSQSRVMAQDSSQALAPSLALAQQTLVLALKAWHQQRAGPRGSWGCREQDTALPAGWLHFQGCSRCSSTSPGSGAGAAPALVACARRWPRVRWDGPLGSRDAAGEPGLPPRARGFIPLVTATSAGPGPGPPAAPGLGATGTGPLLLSPWPGWREPGRVGSAGNRSRRQTRVIICFKWISQITLNPFKLLRRFGAGLRNAGVHRCSQP